jgi:hypothetical protein
MQVAKPATPALETNANAQMSAAETIAPRPPGNFATTIANTITIVVSGAPTRSGFRSPFRHRSVAPLTMLGQSPLHKSHSPGMPGGARG